MFTDNNALMVDVRQRLSGGGVLLTPLEGVVASPGFALSVAAVLLEDGDTYPVKGVGERGERRRALSANALNRLAQAAGLSWPCSIDGDPANRRLDGGNNPRFCEVSVTLVRTGLDGRPYPHTGRKRLDLTDGSDQSEGVIAASSTRAKGMAALRAMRTHILERTVTGARSRAIRQALGLAHAYPEATLRLPFVAVRRVCTGVTGDADLDLRLTEATIHKFLGLEWATPPAFLHAAAHEQTRLQRVSGDAAEQAAARLDLIRRARQADRLYEDCEPVNPHPRHLKIARIERKVLVDQIMKWDEATLAQLDARLRAVEGLAVELLGPDQHLVER